METEREREGGLAGLRWEMIGAIKEGKSACLGTR